MLALPRSDVRAKLGGMAGAVIYIRVSTKEQTKNPSLPTQLRACEEYCRREGSRSCGGSRKRAKLEL